MPEICKNCEKPINNQSSQLCCQHYHGDCFQRQVSSSVSCPACNKLIIGAKPTWLQALDSQAHFEDDEDLKQSDNVSFVDMLMDEEDTDDSDNEEESAEEQTCSENFPEFGEECEANHTHEQARYFPNVADKSSRIMVTLKKSKT